MKKSFFNMIHHGFYFSRPYLLPIANLGDINKIKPIPSLLKRYSFLNKKDWYFFETKKIYKPNNYYRFSGKVYLLTDRNTFSSSDNFVRVFKYAKLGKVVGTSTSGGAAAVSEPWFFSLPNSGIIIRTETDMTFNRDGSINEIYGTPPDVNLGKSTSATPYPSAFTREELLKDSWIRWILKDK